jgi:hypothetical protein
MTHAYELVTVEESVRTSMGVLARESLRWIGAWMSGGDLSQYKFFNYDGYRFFTEFMKVLGTAFLKGHAVLLAVAIASAIAIPLGRWLLLVAVALFFAGHSGTALTGWLFHYGYLSAPAAMMLILIASAGLSMLATRAPVPLRVAAVVLLVAIAWPFTDHKKHAGLYWGGDPTTYDDHVLVYRPGATVPEEH